MAQADLIKIIPHKLVDQNSCEERKSLPYYNGFHTDQPITKWLREVEELVFYK